MFVVMLVITLLTGVGLFATQASSLATRASGYNKQMTQTHYLTEFALQTTIAELSTDKRSAYLKTMAQVPDASCVAVLNKANNTPVTNRTCYRFGYTDLEAAIPVANNKLLVAPAVGASGSLGFVDPNGKVLTEGDFLVEMTDLGPYSPPVAGNDLTSGSVNMQYYSVTLNATGQVRPKSAAANSVDANAGRGASLETSRAHIVIGPLPKF